MIFKKLMLALAGAGLLAAPVNARQATPALWKLADADTTIYLFGTIHALPQGLEWRTPKLDAALAEAKELVLETVIGEPVATLAVMNRLGKSQGLPPLTQRVPTDKAPLIAERLKAVGLPADFLDSYESWAAALTLISATFQQLGINPALGVERGLSADGKLPVAGLETVEYQLGIFDTLSEESQRTLLESALDDPAKAKAEFDLMIAAWSAGDLDGIARTFDAETTMSAELRGALMQKRNTAWAEWLDKRLDKPGTVMVAVGAGHLAGADSVQAMLAKKGLTVERLQ